jgi:hypothetical protein
VTNPNQFSEGIVRVFVNGKIAYEQGKPLPAPGNGKAVKFENAK